MSNPRSSETLYLNHITKLSKCFPKRYLKQVWGALILTVVSVQIAKVCKKIENKVQMSDGVLMTLNHN